MQGIQNKYCHGEEGKMVFDLQRWRERWCLTLTESMYTIYQPTPLLTTSCILYLDICLQEVGGICGYVCTGLGLPVFLPAVYKDSFSPAALTIFQIME